MQLTTSLGLRSLSRPILFGLGLLIGVAGSMIWAARRDDERKARYAYECPMHLMDLHALLMEENSMRRYYPSNLNFVADVFKPKGFAVRTHTYVLVCPGSDTMPGTAFNVSNWTDYIYVDWSRWFPNFTELPGGLPMIYDRRLANHGNRGVYVLRSDGFVMWDPGAQWLRAFADKHPEYRLTVPE